MSTRREFLAGVVGMAAGGTIATVAAVTAISRSRFCDYLGFTWIDRPIVDNQLKPNEWRFVYVAWEKPGKGIEIKVNGVSYLDMGPNDKELVFYEIGAVVGHIVDHHVRDIQEGGCLTVWMKVEDATHWEADNLFSWGGVDAEEKAQIYRTFSQLENRGNTFHEFPIM